jgi:hypothetical protein
VTPLPRLTLVSRLAQSWLLLYRRARDA